ncbi:MAG: hypothetical protein ACRYG4_08780 [Janthinobacterium lividum]
MIPPVTCLHCGLIFQSALASMLGGIGVVSAFGNVEMCPRCGTACASPSGVFDLGAEARRAFTQPGITREQLEAFKLAAQAMRAGSPRDAELARKDLAEINSTFARLLTFTNGNAGAITVLLGIITLFLMLYQTYDSDISSDQAHKDALMNRQEIHSQTEAIVTAAQVQARIDAELEKLNAVVLQPETRQAPTQRTRQTYLPQTQPEVAPMNRRDRRAAASRARKRHSRP